MKMTLKAMFLAGAIAVASTAPASALTLTLAHSTWVGYGPFYIAQKLGFFKDEGVNIKLVTMENTPLKMGALMSGQVDVVASTADEFPTYIRKNKSLKYILAVDNSKGGDGLVAKKDIRSVADLKGHTVAFEEGSVSQFFLNVLLRRAGLSPKDVKEVNMTATDAAVAFAAGRVDAAVTWQPNLDQAVASGRGKILVSSADTPGLIVDVLAVTDKTAKEYPKELKGLVRAWQRALEFLKAHPNQGYEIMAKGVGGWLKKPKDFKEAAAGIEYLDIARNKQMFGTANTPGPLSRTISDAIAIWRERGRIKVANLSASNLVDTSFLN